MGPRGHGIDFPVDYGPIPTSFLERVALALGRVPIPVLDMLYTLMKARAIMAGVRLGIFQAIHEAEDDAAGLAGRLSLDPEVLEMLLRTLVPCGYLVVRDGRFRLSPLARRTMVQGAASDLRGFVLWNYTQWDVISHLEEVVRTGRGADFHRTLTDPEAWGHYQRAMMELARLDAPVVAARVPVRDGARQLLDVAGSHGVLGAALCRRHPPMRSIVLDLPQALPHARELSREAGVQDLVEHRAADIFRDDLGTGHDVVLLSNILHHLDPPACRGLLVRVHAATVRDGTVAIWERDRPQPGSRITDKEGTALFFRLTSSAAAYSGEEYAAWLGAAGWRDVRVRRPVLSPGAVLITARRR